MESVLNPGLYARRLFFLNGGCLHDVRGSVDRAAGVRVDVAHCARADSFELFARRMGERRYEKHLFGDISAMTQRNRAGPALARVLEEEAWHPRLLNGSDYPLPGVMREIRLHNPLLFDVVLKAAGLARSSRREGSSK